MAAKAMSPALLCADPSFERASASHNARLGRRKRVSCQMGGLGQDEYVDNLGRVEREK